MQTTAAKPKNRAPFHPERPDHLPKKPDELFEGILKSNTLNVAGVVDDIIAELMPSVRVRVYRLLAVELEALAKMSIKQSLNRVYGKLGNGIYHFDTDKISSDGDSGKATDQVVAASAPPPKKVVTPEQRRRQQLHGRYVGVIAHATPDVRKKAKVIFAAEGVRAALTFLDRKRGLKKAKVKAKAKKKA